MKKISTLLFVAVASLWASVSLAAPVTTLTTDVVRGISPLTVRVTWSSTGATTCIASGAWSGVKATAGTQTITATANGFIGLRCEDVGGTGSAVLTWIAPTLNTDGSALTDLASFKIYYGPSATTLDRASSDIPNGTLTSTVPGLAAGTWYFSMTTKNAAGIESDRTNLASKVILGTPVQFDFKRIDITVDKKPNPPTGLTVSEVVAYDYQWNEPKFAFDLRPVGVAKLGAACNEKKCLPIADATFCGIYQRKQYTLTKPARSDVIVAKCS